MPVAIYSHAPRIHYVAYGRTSPAYLCFVTYSICLLLVPVVITFTAPIEYSDRLRTFQPRLTPSQSYFVSVDSLEASSLFPVHGIDVQISSVDINGDGISDRLIIQLTGTSVPKASSIYFAIETHIADGSTRIIKGSVDAPSAFNRLTGWFRLCRDNRISLPSGSLHAFLSKPGPRGLSKLFSDDPEYYLTPTGFSSVGEFIGGSSTLQVSLTIDVGSLIHVTRSNPGDLFRDNLIYFVALFAMNYVVLHALYGALIISGSLQTRIYRDYEKES